MDKEAYIESGILDEYALGAASEADRKAVQCLRSVYPEIEEACAEAEAAVAAYGQAFAKTPPPDLKASILAAIGEEDQTTQIASTTTSEKETEAVVRPLESAPAPHRGGSSWGVWAAAASLAGLIAVAAMLWQTRDELSGLQEQVASLQSEKAELVATAEASGTALANAQSQLALATNPNNVVIPMLQAEGKPDALTRVLWNSETKEVFVHVDHMPTPPEGKQYQLWAIKDGQAIDAGVFEVGEAVGDTAIQRMKVIAEAEAFVVTLEKRGGVPVAEGDVWALGNV